MTLTVFCRFSGRGLVPPEAVVVWVGEVRRDAGNNDNEKMYSACKINQLVRLHYRFRLYPTHPSGEPSPEVSLVNCQLCIPIQVYYNCKVCISSSFSLTLIVFQMWNYSCPRHFISGSTLIPGFSSVYGPLIHEYLRL